jgi:Ca2+/H+ antiporter, TMEM165/GDT1 family
MRLRIWQRCLPITLLLLLLTTLAAALVPDSRAKPGSVQHLAYDESASKKPGSVQHLAYDASASKATTLPPSTKPGDVGTKDAPVDGLDGKPHAGPFVEKPKKAAAVVESLSASPRLADQKDKSESWVAAEPDSVMEDRGNRGAQRKGPTGTEGGVSEKDKERKEKQMMGDYVEKKLPPKLPVSHQSEEDPAQYAKAKTEKEGSATEKPKGAQGLEVSLPMISRVVYV